MFCIQIETPEPILTNYNMLHIFQEQTLWRKEWRFKSVKITNISVE